MQEKMPPVDPIQVLDAFAPFLTDTGGITQVDREQFLHLLSIIKNCSTKLVSKCIYCKILMATSSDVLEELLKIGVWDVIFEWIKSSRDEGNTTFLLELLTLLTSLPMNIKRLRENECPKIVKKLCKFADEEIKTKANQIIKKWTKIITAASDKGATDQNGGSATNAKEKKRKTADNNTSSNESSKKAKSSGASSKISAEGAPDKCDSNSNASTESNSNSLIDADPYETFSRTEMNKFMVTKKPEPKLRPSTAKVKPGKFRLDLSAPSTTTAPVKKKTADVKGADVKKVLPLNKATTSANGTFRKIPASSTSAVTLPPVSAPKESMSFIDALSVPPMVKKRRKINKDSEGTTTNKLSNSQERKDDQGNEATSASSSLLPYGSSNHDANSTSNTGNGGSLMPPLRGDASAALDVKPESPISIEAHKSPPRFSFYKDILEDTKSEEDDTSAAASTAVKAESLTEDTSVQEAELPESASPEPAEQPTASDGGDQQELPEQTETYRAPDSTFKPKPILCYVKKGVKKSVRWPDDTQLEKVRSFELDENERINVNRLGADMARDDMKHEAQLMMEAKRQPISYGTWRLIPIILHPTNLPVEKGCNSKEREIQAEKHKNTMECFYMMNMIPESAREPDLEFFGDRDQPKVIPTEDENAIGDNVKDYSGINLQSQPPIQSDATMANFDYANNVHYNPELRFSPNDNNNFPPMVNNGYPASQNPQYQMPPPNPMSNPGYASSGNFDRPNSSYSSYGNNSYSSVNGGVPNNQPPPMYSGNSMYPDYSSNSSNNFGPPGPAPNPGSPPNMFNNPNQPPNFFNQQPPPGSDNYSNNNGYWTEGPNNNNGPPSNNNYPAGPGGPFNMPPQQPPPLQQSGPRFFGRGRGGRFNKKGNDGICRFFAKTGKCKFDTRCNFSHQLDNSKASRF